MAFTAAELTNITNSTLDYILRGQPESQLKQVRPLYDDLMANKKYFSGGAKFITGPVKGQYTSAFVGYTHDDSQTYANPANIKRWQNQWYEMGAGIQVTYTELKANGISVLESNGSATSNHSEAELVQLVNLLEDKIEDLQEGSARSLASTFWRDGSQDAKVFPGLMSFLDETPAVGITSGIDRAAVGNDFWRNRATLGTNAATPANQNLVNLLQKEFRQLRRYGSPMHKFYAGSDFMDALEKELRSNGNYTQTGWAKGGKIDASIADLAFKGVAIQYDPLLDDLTKSKFGYVVDMNAIKWQPMTGEENRVHSPERPPEKYVMYRAITTTGAITANRLNTSGVYSIS